MRPRLGLSSGQSALLSWVLKSVGLRFPPADRNLRPQNRATSLSIREAASAPFGKGVTQGEPTPCQSAPRTVLPSAGSTTLQKHTNPLSTQRNAQGHGTHYWEGRAGQLPFPGGARWIHKNRALSVCGFLTVLFAKGPQVMPPWTKTPSPKILSKVMPQVENSIPRDFNSCTNLFKM